MNRFFLSMFVFAMIVFPFTGCQKGRLKTNYIEGVVTLDGQPIEGVNVNFTPATPGVGEAAGGMTDASGKYGVTSVNGGAFGRGAVEGDYIVTLTKLEVTTFDAPISTPSGLMYSSSEEKMPQEYTDIQHSPLKRTVVKGKNTFNFDITSQ